MHTLQHLLDKLELIRLRQESRNPTDSFNIFRLLRPEHDEVNLHSRFIHELLNPKGSHGMGDAFLRLFAFVCQLPALSYDNVQVLREHANIDILIQDNLHAVVIENKIYAGDQHEQIKRYHDFAVRSLRTPTLFYLTLDGTPPSDWSLGDLQAEVKCLSYSQEIDSWLTACIKEAATQPTLRETIIQYQQLIQQLTGKNMNEDEKQQVLELMAKDNNVEQAAIIARNWNHVRWHVEWDFWNELVALIEKYYTVSDIEKFSPERITTVVHGSRNKDYTYGILFQIGRLSNQDLYLKIERGDEPTYYGLRNPFGDENDSQRLILAIQNLTRGPWESFAGWKHTEEGIDFQNFSTSPTTLRLVNVDRRQTAVSAVWSDIQNFITEVSQLIEQEFGSDFTPVPTKA